MKLWLGLIGSQCGQHHLKLAFHKIQIEYFVIYALLFCSSHFWFLVTFDYEVTKILFNCCLHFARRDRQDGKKCKENHATEVTKIPKTKSRKYGMNETFMTI